MSDIDENSDRRLSDTSEKYEGTEHYTLVKTKDGWHGDPDGYSWQWFDFPDITFTDDGDCHFELEAEAIDMAVELDTYREFLAILSREIENSASKSTVRKATRIRPRDIAGGYLRQRTANVLWTPTPGTGFPDPIMAKPRHGVPRPGRRKWSGAQRRDPFTFWAVCLQQDRNRPRVRRDTELKGFGVLGLSGG